MKSASDFSGNYRSGPRGWWVFLVLPLGVACLAQRLDGRGGRGGGFLGGGEISVDDSIKTARELATQSVATPRWTNIIYYPLTH